MGMHDLTGKEEQFQHANEVTGRGCRISRVRNIRPNMPTRYQVGAAGSHGLGTHVGLLRHTGISGLAKFLYGII